MAQSKEKSSSSGEMTFFEHLDALRPHLVRGAVALFVIMTAAFVCRHFIIDVVLLGPQRPDFPVNRWLGLLAERFNTPELKINTSQLTLINTTMAGQFNLHLKISFWTALVLAIPYMIWELWQFIKPALTPSERRGSNKMVLYVSSCFLAGILFGYFIVSPLTVNFLGGYQASGMISNMIDANSYLSTIMNVSLACGFVFLLPVLSWVLSRMGILNSAFMRQYRRHSIIVLAVVSAIITPPDLFSMVLVMLPLCALYEVSIAIVARVERRRAEDEAAAEAAYRRENAPAPISLPDPAEEEKND
ncbi:MAG: twin-arginine translocase subunit TatC [Rikenellaceae bacterium]|jgi:sec-independent protein translocase protein TatC|nr:twin-arginine translocase subunit TatC [Rikenellaceae bacterium]